MLRKMYLKIFFFGSLLETQLTLFPSFPALETTQAELFDLKTKYDEESTAKYVSYWSTCVFADNFSPLAPPYSVPDINVLFSESPSLETPPLSA